MIELWVDVQPQILKKLGTRLGSLGIADVRESLYL
jgi:hypothetical protein